MQQDKILEAFNNASDNYDKYRKQAIPNMDIFYKTLIDEITGYTKPEILDLGAGTGILSEMIYNIYPTSNLTLLDFSEDMLKKAEKKFENTNNIKYIKADYLKYDFTNKYDIITSSLSIHHLENTKKQELYNKIYDTLNHGGIFVNADLALGNTPNTEEIYKQKDYNHLKKQDIPEEEKQKLTERRKLDKPATIKQNMKYLEKAGFTDVDVYYKYYRYFVMKAKKE